MNALQIRAAFSALLATLATVWSVAGIADIERREGQPAAAQAELRAAADGSVQQVIIVGHRAKG